MCVCQPMTIKMTTSKFIYFVDDEVVELTSPHLPKGSSAVCDVSFGSFSTRNIKILRISDSLEYKKVW